MHCAILPPDFDSNIHDAASSKRVPRPPDQDADHTLSGIYLSGPDLWPSFSSFHKC